MPPFHLPQGGGAEVASPCALQLLGDTLNPGEVLDGMVWSSLTRNWDKKEVGVAGAPLALASWSSPGEAGARPGCSGCSSAPGRV